MTIKQAREIERRYLEAHQAVRELQRELAQAGETALAGLLQVTAGLGSIAAVQRARGYIECHEAMSKGD